jgi:hypothetical protein
MDRELDFAASGGCGAFRDQFRLDPARMGQCGREEKSEEEKKLANHLNRLG